MNEELIKRLQEMRDAVFMSSDGRATLNAAIAALTQQAEPENTEMIMPHVHDLYAALGIKWGDDPFTVIQRLRNPTATASGVKEGMPANRTDYVSRAMVDAFLSWRLPEDFSPDAGISFTRDYNQNTPYPRKHEPIGTNLFSADQAREMLEYVTRESRRLEGERATRAVAGMAKAFEGLGAGRAITRAADQVNVDSYSAGVDRDREAGIYRDTVPSDQVSQQDAVSVPKWAEEELADGDRILSELGLERTEGGRMPVAKVIAMLRAAQEGKKC